MELFWKTLILVLGFTITVALIMVAINMLFY